MDSTVTSSVLRWNQKRDLLHYLERCEVLQTVLSHLGGDSNPIPKVPASVVLDIEPVIQWTLLRGKTVNFPHSQLYAKVSSSSFRQYKHPASF